MKDNVKVGMSIYHAKTTKYIVFTICAVILIRVLQNVIISLSGCNNFRENASRAVEFSEKAFTAYKDIRQPQRFGRQ